MSDFYDEMAVTALETIKEFGQSIPLTRSEGSNYDPVDETETPSSSSDNLVGLVLPASKGTTQGFDNRYMSNTLVDSSIRFVLAAAKGVKNTPKNGDKLYFESMSWEITGVTPVAPGGIPLIYRIGVKK